MHSGVCHSCLKCRPSMLKSVVMASSSPGFVRSNAQSSPMPVRTDLSATLFLTDPADYDGGELVIEDTFGTHSVKLPAGDLVLYSATSRHHVTPVTRGSRWSSFFWIQSMIRDEAARTMLYELDNSIQGLRARPGRKRGTGVPDGSVPQSRPPLGRCMRTP